MKGSDSGNEVQRQHLPGGTEENHKELPLGKLMLWPGFKPYNSETQVTLPLSCDKNRIFVIGVRQQYNTGREI
jgi:hypothetical protein